MDFKTVIGLEVHAQLLTQSKMFCSCSTDYLSAPPNTRVCPICLGMPGTLPAINRKAIEYTIMTALALDCTIPEYTKFDRKSYFYPDLMKGYQISQYDAPVGRNGQLSVGYDGERKVIGITRVHLEEDVAKLWHRGGYSLIDVNRSGVPLMEVVSEPDITSPEEARDYLMKLRLILRYLGVSTGNMEAGSFRCDANISVHPRENVRLGAKVEVKNMNSFKAVYEALKYETERQQKMLAEGRELVQETRGWIPERGVTALQRRKEYADDYRYFPEPDLPPLVFEQSYVEKVRRSLPELPESRRDRFVAQYGLSLYDASVLTGSKDMADYFESCCQLSDNPKAVCNWLLGDFSRLLNATDIDVNESKVTCEQLVELIRLIDQGVIGGPAAKTVLEHMFESGKQPKDIVEEKRLSQITNAEELRGVVKEVIATNSKAVLDFKGGKEQSLKFLTGQTMRTTKGRANPAVVRELLLEELRRD
jgi:aspartyl-tRNA(Asn)/glutamyl-tRNA(Gln) amidotransferase subunit B